MLTYHGCNQRDHRLRHLQAILPSVESVRELGSKIVARIEENVEEAGRDFGVLVWGGLICGTLRIGQQEVKYDWFGIMKIADRSRLPKMEGFVFKQLSHRSGFVRRLLQLRYSIRTCCRCNVCPHGVDYTLAGVAPPACHLVGFRNYAGKNGGEYCTILTSADM